MPTKPALASVTIWGLLIAAFCTSFPGAAAFLHLTDPSIQASIQTIMGTLGTLVGLCVALYGRFHTSTPIAGLVKTPSSGGLPPAAANLFVIAPLLFLLVLAGPLLSACSTTGGTFSAAGTASQVLGSVTAAVNAHPVATAAGRLDAERAFTVAAGGLEAAYQAGVLNAATVKTAKADLETARSVLLAARAAFVLTGVPSSADLVTAQAAADATFARVDAELVTS